MDQYISRRSWMYDRKYPRSRTLKAHFKEGVEEFVTYAMSRDIVKSEGGIRCPCIKCSCGLIQSPEDVITHLEKVGFMNDYYVWRLHGEKVEPPNNNIGFDVNTNASSSGARAECENFSQMQDMVGGALGVKLSYGGGNKEEIIPNVKAPKFFAMMEEVNKLLFEGASDSKLSMCVRLLAAKSNWNLPEDCLEFFSKMMLDATPVKDNMPTSYNDAKRLMSKLGLQVKGGNVHTQGSIGVSTHAQELIKRKSGDLDIAEVHKETHTRRRMGAFVDQRTETTQVFGLGKMNNKYDFGKLAPNVRYENILHVPTSEAKIQRLTQELQAQREELDKWARLEQETQERLNRLDREAAERRAIMEEQIRIAMNEQKRQMNEYFRQMLASTSRNVPNDQIDPNDNEDADDSN